MRRTLEYGKIGREVNGRNTPDHGDLKAVRLHFGESILHGCGKLAAEGLRRSDYHRVKASYDEQHSNQTPQKIAIALGSIINGAGGDGTQDGAPCLHEDH